MKQYVMSIDCGKLLCPKKVDSRKLSIDFFPALEHIQYVLTSILSPFSKHIHHHKLVFSLSLSSARLQKLSTFVGCFNTIPPASESTAA